MKNGKMVLMGSAFAAVLVMGTSFSAFAASVSAPADDGASFGYLTGQQKNKDRHAQYEAVAGFTTDEEREAYFQAQGIGGDGPYSAAPHLDAQAFVDAGIIGQETADSIASYASKKHDEIHGRYAGMEDLTDEERWTLYGDFENDGFSGDALEELVKAGILTREQADGMAAYDAGVSGK